MVEESESKADGLNFSEMKAAVMTRIEAESPIQPIRKRGYYRALKRRAAWALMRKATNDMLNNVIEDLNCPSNVIYEICGLSEFTKDDGDL